MKWLDLACMQHQHQQHASALLRQTQEVKSVYMGRGAGAWGGPLVAGWNTLTYVLV